MTNVLLASWDKLLSWWDVSGNEELKRSTVILIRNILRVDPKVHCGHSTNIYLELHGQYNMPSNNKLRRFPILFGLETFHSRSFCLMLLNCRNVKSKIHLIIAIFDVIRYISVRR